MPEEKSAAEVARDLADALERVGIRYAIGGALALGFYAVPRATVDVDINVFVSPTRELRRALDALQGEGARSFSWGGRCGSSLPRISSCSR